MESWGNSALTGNSYKDVLSKTTRICLLLGEEEVIDWKLYPIFQKGKVRKEDQYAKPSQKSLIFDMMP